MNFAITLLIYNLLNLTSIGNCPEQETIAKKNKSIFTAETGLAESTGYHRLTLTYIFTATKSAAHKSEGLVKDPTPMLQAKAYAAIIESYNITNTNLIVLFVHSP